jgi:redox-sensitive bicupin YhaK (pirin superfamily)/predicted CoA-binding protein
MSNAIELMIEARPRDLGGFTVGRVLPALRRRSVGPFVFLDHMGPVDDGEIMVRPHPHINLATVTYLFEGAVHHRDSLGSHQVIEPGAINWMNAGAGIVHSERSGQRMAMHGLQLWVGLPKSAEESKASFDHYPASILPTFDDGGVKGRVLAGAAYGLTSPVKTHSPLFYLDLELKAGAQIDLPPYSERAIYVISGAVTVGEERIEPKRMAVFAKDAKSILVAETATRLVILGGEPLDGPRFIWWNFVSSDQARILDAIHAWKDKKFPTVPGDDVEFIPAPEEEPRFAAAYHKPTDDQLRAILKSAKTIAMVDASNSPDRPSNAIMKQMLAAGYRVIPVNPNEAEVLGQPAVKSLSEINEPVDIVDVFRKSEDVPAIADEAIKIGAKTLWMQLGVKSDEAAMRALLRGLNVVMDTCIGATHKRLRM